MKYFVAAVLAVSLCAVGAQASFWDSFVSETAHSIKAFFAPVEGPDAAPAPVASEDLPLHIPPAEAKFYLEHEKPDLLDVRTPSEYSAGHIETARSVDYYAADFRDQLSRMDNTAAYLIYCRSGKRSAAALEIMRELGFTDIHDIAGGFNAWAREGFPTVK